jgi:hypothetical protein
MPKQKGCRKCRRANALIRLSEGGRPIYDGNGHQTRIPLRTLQEAQNHLDQCHLNQRRVAKIKQIPQQQHS